MTKPLAKLKIVKPEALARAFDIPEEGLTIGNDASQQLCLHDPNILSVHGKVIATEAARGIAQQSTCIRKMSRERKKHL